MDSYPLDVPISKSCGHFDGGEEAVLKDLNSVGGLALTQELSDWRRKENKQVKHCRGYCGHIHCTLMYFLKYTRVDVVYICYIKLPVWKVDIDLEGFIAKRTNQILKYRFYLDYGNSFNAPSFERIPQ